MRSKVIVLSLALLFCCFLHCKAQVPDSVSRVFLSTHVEIDAEDSTQYLVEIPHPFFDEEHPVVFFYIETELGRILGSEKAFLFLEVKKRSNHQFKYKPVFTRRIEFSDLISGRLIDSLDINTHKIPSGNYDLIVSLMNDSTRVLNQKKASFQVLSNYQLDESDYTLSTSMAQDDNMHKDIDINKTFVGKYTIAQLQKNIAALSPVSKGAEARVIDDLRESKNEMQLKRFFYNFWYDRYPGAPEKAWNDYASKLNKVAKEYGTASLPGYETDRGRIYLIYGEPDVRERVPSEKGALPYEVWFYRHTEMGRGNVKFLFYQPGMIGNQLFLLHSTEPDVIINPQWKSFLFLDPNDNDNRLTHRVSEYFK